MFMYKYVYVQYNYKCMFGYITLYTSPPTYPSPPESPVLGLFYFRFFFLTRKVSPFLLPLTHPLSRSSQTAPFFTGCPALFFYACIYNTHIHRLISPLLLPRFYAEKKIRKKEEEEEEEFQTFHLS